MESEDSAAKILSISKHNYFCQMCPLMLLAEDPSVGLISGKQEPLLGKSISDCLFFFTLLTPFSILSVTQSTSAALGENHLMSIDNDMQYVAPRIQLIVV